MEDVRMCKVQHERRLFLGPEIMNINVLEL